MESEINLRYFPKTEAIIFSFATIVCIACSYLLGLSVWLVIALIFIAYIVTLAGTTAVSVTNESLKITSLDPFSGSQDIDIKSIIKLKRLDVLPEGETRTSFSLFTRRCEVQYLNKHEQKNIIYFSIFNKKAEKQVMKALRKLTKKEKIEEEEEIEEEDYSDDILD